MKFIILILIAASVSSQTFEEAPEIVAISISGNDHLSRKELYAQMHLKEKVRFIKKGSFYNQHQLAREIRKLENYYTLNGYLDTHISDSLSFTNDNGVHIFLTVEEGKQYYLRDVTLSGNRIFSDKEYLDLIEYQAGSSFNTFKIRENLVEMLALYQNNGYPLINIQDSVVVDDSVSLYINVVEGPKLGIGTINFTETDSVPIDLIKRELIVKTGDVFNLANIEESKRRLYETNLFNSVNIRMGDVDQEEGSISLNVEVIAAKFRGFDMEFGLKQGYTDGAGIGDRVLSLGISGSWYHNNLFDSSRRIRIQSEINSIFPTILTPQQFKFDLFYIEPWLSKYRVPLTINPFYWYVVDDANDFENTAYGLRGIVTYRWFRKIKVQGISEWNQSYSKGDPLEEKDLYQEARTIRLKFTWDERDNFFYPHKGFKWIVEPSLVGHFLGGENSYMQFQSSIGSYWNLFRDIVFAHNFDIAIGIQNDPNSPIPYNNRYFLGGSSSIRGYEQKALGPEGHVDGESNSPGGNLRYFSNFELRFPVYGIFGGEIFMDIGNLWSDIENANFSEYHLAVGAGITMDTPIGPARIDYGVPVGNNASINSGQAHIAIAYAF